MKLLFVYDNADLTAGGRIIDTVPLTDHVHVSTKVHDGPQYLYEVATAVKKKLSDDGDWILFIDQYLRCKDDAFGWLQNNSGIALIKFLRMLGVPHHMVLISPFSGRDLLLIKENPGNLILTSRGISIARYWSEFRDMGMNDLLAMAKVRFDNTLDLRPYILAEFSLPGDDRHNWANWWGIDRLWNVHKVIENKRFYALERWELKEYPLLLKKKLFDLRNRQALFLYGHQEQVIENKLAELRQERWKREQIVGRYENAVEESLTKIIATSTELAAMEEQQEELEALIALAQELLPQLGRDVMMNDFSVNEHFKKLIAILQKETDLRELITALSDQKRRIENALGAKKSDYRQVIAELKNEEKRLLDRFYSQLHASVRLVKEMRSDIQAISIEALRDQLSLKRPRLLYIDDQADEGWANIFQYILYGDIAEEFKYIQPKSRDKINQVYFTEVVAPVIASHRPEVVLLDLRLNREHGVRLDVEELSGAVLLKEIRSVFPGMPVLITTASDKFWSYRELHRLGCDAFWTKEGIDTGMSEMDSIKNYLRFAEFVVMLTGSDYQFLRQYSLQLATLKNKGHAKNHWWQRRDRFKNDLLPVVAADRVYLILCESAKLFQECLRAGMVKQLQDPHRNEVIYAAQIIQGLGRIVDMIHDVGTPVSSDLFDDRKDAYGSALFIQKQDAQRIAGTGILRLQDAADFMGAMLRYLDDRENHAPVVGERIAINHN